MIQSNELRIGNLVWEPYGGYYKVFGIKPNKNITISKNERTLKVDFKQKELEPIPLSEEVLLKCAQLSKETENDLYGKTFLIKNTNFILRRVNFSVPITEKEDYGFALELSDEENWVKIVDRINHLHHLQNIVKDLTNQELTINL